MCVGVIVQLSGNVGVRKPCNSRNVAMRLAWIHIVDATTTVI
jgi:hypothetical protein